MIIKDQDDRVLNVIKTFKSHGELTVVVDTKTLTDEAWQTGVDQATEQS
jgi:hypothetical protein